MSAGICGKRPAFEDLFASSSSSSSPPKRSRRSRYYGSDDNLSFLLRMFPSMDREVVETVLNSHNANIDEAIKSLHTLYLVDDGSARDESVSLDPSLLPNHIAVEDGMSYPASENKAEETEDNILGSDHYRLPDNESSWADLFVQQVKTASSWDDVRGRTAKFLEAFETSVLGQCSTSEEEKQQEISLRKEQVQYLLRDNQILKRAVTIQHGRNLEHEEKLKEVQQLKHAIGQYQEQARTLELNNYTLKLHLQRTQGSNSMPSHFHPDIF